MVLLNKFDSVYPEIKKELQIKVIQSLLFAAL